MPKRTSSGQGRLPGLEPEPMFAPPPSHARPFPFVDETGMVWRDYESGEPAQIDSDGRLTKRFVLGLKYFREHYPVGTRLPRTPKAQDLLEEKIRKEREARTPELPQEEVGRPKKGGARKAA